MLTKAIIATALLMGVTLSPGPADARELGLAPGPVYAHGVEIAAVGGAAAVRTAGQAAPKATEDLQSTFIADGEPVDESVPVVSNLVTFSAIGIVFLLIAATVAVISFSRVRLMGLLAKLSKSMEALADGDYEIVVPFMGKTNEIGAMASAVEVFRNNAIERRRAESELQESEQKIRALVDTMTDGIITIDPAGIVRSANPAALGQFGYELAEILGQKINILIPEEYACNRDTYVSSNLQIKVSKAVGKQRELTGRRKDGSTFPLELSVSELVFHSEKMFTGHIRDITERKNAEAKRAELEQELSQIQKLESLGTLAGGIAHEINTPIQFVGDNTRFLKSAFADLSTVLEKHQNLLEAAATNNVLADVIAEASAAAEAADMEFLVKDIPAAIDQSLDGLHQIAEIVKAIKEFSYPNTKEKNPADINRAIATTITVCRNQWKYAAELETDLDATLPLVPCLLGEFNQVILNLIVNAAHAIEENGEESKGRITISTRRIEGWAEVCIRDTGVGIPKDIHEKIFEPFFTTKEPGKGTGQGLAISRTIITKKHGGTFALQSEAGKGTQFIIRLPLLDPDQSEVAA